MYLGPVDKINDKLCSIIFHVTYLLFESMHCGGSIVSGGFFDLLSSCLCKLDLSWTFDKIFAWMVDVEGYFDVNRLRKSRKGRVMGLECGCHSLDINWLVDLSVHSLVKIKQVIPKIRSLWRLEGTIQQFVWLETCFEIYVILTHFFWIAKKNFSAPTRSPKCNVKKSPFSSDERMGICISPSLLFACNLRIVEMIVSFK